MACLKVSPSGEFLQSMDRLTDDIKQWNTIQRNYFLWNYPLGFHLIELSRDAINIVENTYYRGFLIECYCFITNSGLSELRVYWSI